MDTRNGRKGFYLVGPRGENYWKDAETGERIRVDEPLPSELPPPPVATEEEDDEGRGPVVDAAPLASTQPYQPMPRLQPWAQQIVNDAADMRPELGPDVTARPRYNAATRSWTLDQTPLYSTEGQEALKLAKGVRYLPNQWALNNILQDQGMVALLTADEPSAFVLDDRIQQIRSQPRAQSMSEEQIKQQAIYDLATARTYGLWLNPIKASAQDASWGEVLTSPTIEVLGLDEKGQVIYRQQTSGGYAIDALSFPAIAAGNVIERGLRATLGEQPGAVPMPSMKQAIRERRSLSQAVREDIAIPQGEGVLPTLGRATLAGGAALVDVLTPDPVSLTVAAVKPVAALTRAAASTSKLAASAARIEAATKSLRAAMDSGAITTAAGRDKALKAIREAEDAITGSAGIRGGRVDVSLVPTAEFRGAIADAKLTRPIHTITDLSEEGQRAVRMAAKGTTPTRVAESLFDSMKKGELDDLLPYEQTKLPQADIDRLAELEAKSPPWETGTPEFNEMMRLREAKTAQIAPIFAVSDLLSQAMGRMASSMDTISMELRESIRASKQAGGFLGRKGQARLTALKPVTDKYIVPLLQSIDESLGSASMQRMFPVQDAARKAGSLLRSIVRIASVGADEKAALRAAGVSDEMADELFKAIRGAETAIEEMLQKSLDAFKVDPSKGERAIDAILRAVPLDLAQSVARSMQLFPSKAIALLEEYRIAGQGNLPLDEGFLTQLSNDIKEWFDSEADIAALKARGVKTLEVPKVGPALQRFADLLPTDNPAALRDIAAQLTAQGAVQRTLTKYARAGRVLENSQRLVLDALESNDLRALANARSSAASRAAEQIASGTGTLKTGSVEVSRGELRDIAMGQGKALNMSPDMVRATILNLRGFPVDLAMPTAIREKLTEQILGSISRRRMAPVPDAAKGVAMAILQMWSKSVTRGSLTTRARYYINNTFGNVEQVYIQHGLATAVKYAIQNEVVTIVPILAQFTQEVVGQIGKVAAPLSPAVVGKLVATGVMGSKTGIKIMREVTAALQTAATAVGRPLTRFLSKAGYYPGVTDIIAGEARSFTIAGKAYTAAELRRIAVEGGVFDSFDSLLDEAASKRFEFDLEEKMGAFAFPAKFNQELASVISTRQRVGLYLVLMERGFSPELAAKGVVDALYDYRFSVDPSEREIITKVLLPFWAWQKNANRQLISAMQSPAMAYRLAVWIKGRETAADWADWYAMDERDEFGVYTERMAGDPDAMAAYDRLKPRLMDILSETDGEDTPMSRKEIQSLLYSLDVIGDARSPRSGTEGNANWENRIDSQTRADISMVQPYIENPAWEAGLAQRDRENAIVRLALKRSPPGKVPHAEDVWMVAMPPSGMEGAMRYSTAFAATGLTMIRWLWAGASGGTPPSAPIGSIMDQVAEPDRTVVGQVYNAATTENPRIPISASTHYFLSMVNPTFAEASIRSENPADNRYYITDPLVAAVYKGSPLEALDRSGKISDRIAAQIEQGTITPEDLIPTVLQAAGFDARTIRQDGAATEMRSASGKGDRFLQNAAGDAAQRVQQNQ